VLSIGGKQAEKCMKMHKLRLVQKGMERRDITMAARGLGSYQ
jgi:hypothetical protein